MPMSTRELGNSGSILGVKDSSEQTKSIKYSQMTLEPKRKKKNTCERRKMLLSSKTNHREAGRKMEQR